MTIDVRRRSVISVEDLLCRNVSQSSSCPSPTINTEPSTAALSSPELSLDHTAHRFSNYSSTDMDSGSPSEFEAWHVRSAYEDQPPRPFESHLKSSILTNNARDPRPLSDVAEQRQKSVRGPWRIEEDRLLIELVGKYGARHWSAIATHFPRRSGKQARERWMNQLNPNLKKKNWSAGEDRTILRAHATLGNKWSAIANLLPGRTDNSVKNRFNSTLKRAMKERSLTSQSLDIDKFVQELHAKPYELNQNLYEQQLDRSFENVGYQSARSQVCYSRSTVEKEGWSGRLPSPQRMGIDNVLLRNHSEERITEEWAQKGSGVLPSHTAPRGQAQLYLPDASESISLSQHGRQHFPFPPPRLASQFGPLQPGSSRETSPDPFIMPGNREMQRSTFYAPRLPSLGIIERKGLPGDAGNSARGSRHSRLQLPMQRTITKARRNYPL